MDRLGNAGRSVVLIAIATMMLAAGGCQSNLKEENDALRMENLELRDRLSAEQAAREAADAERLSLMDQLATRSSQPAVGAGQPATGFEGMGLDVERGAAGEITVRIPGDVLFESGKVELRDSAKRSLTQIAGVLKGEHRNNTVRIEGYTDSDPIRRSSWKDNLELSAQRAMAVHRFLESQGVSSDRMYASGFGATKFRASNATAQGKAQNRRVEIVVVR